MKLAILTQYYPPEIGAPQTRLSELAAHMVRRSHSVTALTAMPNYPIGRVYDGYGGWFRREERHGVNVLRTLIYPTQSPKYLPRLTNYFSFVTSSAIVGTVCLERPDYLLVESPPLFLGLSGYWLSRCKRTRLIFNVSDLWPETAVSLGLVRRESRVFHLSQALEAFCYRKAWLVTGQSRSILADISRRFPDRPTFLLSNGVDTTRFGPDRRTRAARAALGNSQHFVVLYAGMHGLAQGLEQVLFAAETLAGEDGFRFVFVGDGPEKASLRAAAERRRLGNVSFLDPRPSAEIPALLAAADVVLVPLKTQIPGAVPSKLYEAMASGRPVVLAADGEAAEVVRGHHAGMAVPAGDAGGIINALRTLRAEPSLRQALGANARRTAQQYFDRSTIAGRFIDYLEAELPQ